MEPNLLKNLVFTLLLSILVTSHWPRETWGLTQVLENGSKSRENDRAMNRHHNNYFYNNKKSFDKNSNNFLLDYDSTDLYTNKNKEYIVDNIAGDIVPGTNIEIKPTTLQVIHTTIRVMGVIATFIAFIVTPIIQLIVSAVVTGKEFARSFNNFPNTFFNHWNSSSSRNTSRSFGSIILGEEEARGILDTSRCLERLSCYAQTNGFGRRSFLQTFAQKTSMEGGRQIDVCAQYHCYPFSFIVRLFIYLIDWNTLLKV